MSLKDVQIKNSYVGKGYKILNDFLMPTLSQSISYDRITGYYTIESLIAISQGVEKLLNTNGKMRLIIGIHDFPVELVDATLQKEFLDKEISKVRKEITKNIMSLSNALEKKQLATLAWMIEDGFLEVKAAAVKDENDGIFHAKTLIFRDEENEVVAVGSANETRNGLGGNIEQLVVLKSWESSEGVKELKDFFISLWNNNEEDTVVTDITEDTAKMISNCLGDEYRNPNSNKKKIDNIISQLSKMPANFFVSGYIPALFMHQERAVIDAMSRWPVRVLFADEVGLGKTFEAAATLVYLVKYCKVKRAVILTPKSVLQQWQDELKTNFGLNVWLYDSGSKSYISPEGHIKFMNGKNPIGVESPDLMLISAQYARGSRGSNNIFEHEGAILPELLIVDEAHSARISADIIGGKKKTLMYKMLEKVKTKIPHFILATATPMMKSAEEYHAMLNLLGLPKGWDKEKFYNLSLNLISTDNIPDSTDAFTASKLLLSTINTMRPTYNVLSDEEKSCVEELLLKNENSDKNEMSLFVREKWNLLKNIFIKLHPANLLTVRNTRRALTDMGYKFPKRILKDIDIENSYNIDLFYDEVYKYLSNECFSIEKARDPEKKINIGFIKVSYQQRVASSLYSCEKSLNRRYEKAKEIVNALNTQNSYSSDIGTLFSLNSFMDDQEYDNSTNNDEEIIQRYQNQEINLDELKRAASIECASLSSLISKCQKIKMDEGDKKIKSSIKLALEKLDEDVSVLLFTRYTDTIDALIDEFIKVEGDKKFAYGVYTGNKSVIMDNGIEEQCTKTQIKEALFSKKMKILFCSDAASEGLNLQFARVLINVDVPWTPARLEQRIGRIARLGQVADEVYIYNVWYPNSIEAKMYKRIQRRLEKTNIAIGEFPEVIAENIKNSILDNNVEDNSVRDLRDIRNSIQTKALEQLWSTKTCEYTISDKIRKQLIELCDIALECVEENTEEKIKKYKMSDNNIVSLSERSGLSESVSLKSIPFQLYDYVLNDFEIRNDKSANASAIVAEDDSKYLKYDEVIRVIIDGTYSENQFTNQIPTMLPNVTDLNLYFINEEFNIKEPMLWPYIKEDLDEN